MEALEKAEVSSEMDLEGLEDDFVVLVRVTAYSDSFIVLVRVVVCAYLYSAGEGCGVCIPL